VINIGAARIFSGGALFPKKVYDLFSPPWGVQVHPLHPWLRLWWYTWPINQLKGDTPFNRTCVCMQTARRTCCQYVCENGSLSANWEMDHFAYKLGNACALLQFVHVLCVTVCKCLHGLTL